MTEKDVERLLLDEGIIRHRGKIQAVINNARILKKQNLSLQELLGKHTPTEDRTGLTLSPESTNLSKELRKLGFNFVGPTTMHAMMQAIGVINDHDLTCEFRKN
jgi:DNA-3-methyladenine glycosylase I